MPLLPWLATLFAKPPVVAPAALAAPVAVVSPTRPAPIVPKSVNDLTSREVIACTLWGEARGEGVRGMEAVAAVIANRAKTPGWWGQGPRTVCLSPFQFSCWNDDDPNRPKMLRVAATPDADFRSALAIADRMPAGFLTDPTGGATHYVMTTIIGKTKWARGKAPSAVIGCHTFFKLGLSG